VRTGTGGETPRPGPHALSEKKRVPAKRTPLKRRKDAKKRGGADREKKFRKNLQIFMKNRENPLDIRRVFFYDK
jgi:hypothetical protein